jgi:transcriptional regulator with XRE-family HTH domain
VILAENDISIKELAAASGLHAGTLSRIVNGRKPTIDSAYAISDALGLHVNKVFPNYYSYASLHQFKNKTS